MLKRTLVFFIMLSLLILSACHRTESESSGTRETTAPTETTTPTGPTAPTETTVPTETNPEETTSPTGEVIIPEAKVLPDSFGLARGGEDICRDNSYYIAALDLELSLPQGYYLYHVQGLCRGDEEDLAIPLRAAFIDEYILTNRKMEEEALIKEIYACQDPCMGDETNLMNPPYILWNFRVYHKDYLPLAKFFASRITMSRELRLKGDYVVEMGSTRWADINDSYYVPLESLEFEEVQAAATVDNFIEIDRLKEISATRYDYPLLIDKDEYPVEGWIQAVSGATAGTGLSYRYFFYWDGWDPNPFSNPEDNMARWSEEKQLPLLDEGWWASFKQAAQELRERPGEYTYPNLQDLCRDGWYTDNERDITLRAFIWAGLPLSEDKPSLSEVVILLHDTDNACPLYQAYIVRDGETNLLMEGLDVTGLCNFDKTREYGETK